ncbi:MAG: SPFH domain-containing protein [Acetatifactor sp.]|nr:SPFH domain-containing protein [Acetatifactor sp.]MDE7114721.1 SPFH domain-containing protein [Acetatifactor sp.]
MGLIKAAKDVVSSMLADQWQEYFYCDSLSDEVLMVKGQKRTNGNNKGVDNIISNGSIIAVNEGQCMIIVDQGGIVEFCADPGEFIFDTSTEPSIFAGNLGVTVTNTFKTMVRRFAGAGDPMKDQRVYFFNIKEIKGNLYGTATPIPFRVVDNKIGLDIDTVLRCNGEYTYKLVDPLLFYKNIAGNKKDNFPRSELTSIMKSEMLTALQPALAKVSAIGVRPSEIPGHITELVDFLNEELSEKWTQLRGIQVVSMTMNPPSIPEEDRKMINDLQKTAVLTNPGMAAATLTAAQAEAMKAAASNESTGPMMAFAGMNMANMVGGMDANALYQMNAQNQMNMQNQMNGQPAGGNTGMRPPQMQPPVLGWECSCGKTDNRGKFCAECGQPKPATAGWTCSCGAVNQGKFCSECGAKKPEGAPMYKCDKCGWEPEDPTNPPKFCPECGDIFDENDRK